jgi:hypothetical protein
LRHMRATSLRSPRAPPLVRHAEARQMVAACSPHPRACSAFRQSKSRRIRRRILARELLTRRRMKTSHWHEPCFHTGFYHGSHTCRRAATAQSEPTAQSSAKSTHEKIRSVLSCRLESSCNKPSCTSSSIGPSGSSKDAPAPPEAPRRRAPDGATINPRGRLPQTQLSQMKSVCV